MVSHKHTQVWDHKVKKVKDIGDHGDIEHLRADMVAKDIRHIRLNANDLCWLVPIELWWCCAYYSLIQYIAHTSTNANTIVAG